jgi:hypothetical protein
MTKAQVNALIASAYNLHVGIKTGGEAMTPAKAANLPRGDRAMLCKVLSEKGGSDLYTQAQATDAMCAVIEHRA